MALVGHGFVPPVQGWTPPYVSLQQGNIEEFAKAELAGWTGINYQDPSPPNILEIINPLNMTRAPYWKMLFWTGLTETLINKFAPSISRKLGNIPFIGKYITI